MKAEQQPLSDCLFQFLFGLKVMITVHDTSFDLPACADSNIVTLAASSPPQQLHCLTPQKIPKDFSRHNLAA